MKIRDFMDNRSMNNAGGELLVGHSVFDQIISLENLLAAWREFKRGKMKKADVLEFEFNLEDNLFEIAEQLATQKYAPDKYDFFYVRDPKLRPIHKASVRDRVVFQAVFRVLYHIFDKQFIHDSYSCRYGKGTHSGVRRLQRFMRSASGNNKKQVFALKCDIKQFFYSVDHSELKRIIKWTINDVKLLCLLGVIIDSFHVEQGKGIPLGNVTSQVFAKIYINELDDFIKYKLREKFYLRYCDDFIVVSDCGAHLSNLALKIQAFLSAELKLSLHFGKLQIRRFSQGIDFLGYVSLPYYSVLRTKTKKRMFRRLSAAAHDLKAGLIGSDNFNQVLQSYLGILQHCASYRLRQELLRGINFQSLD